MRLKRGDDRLLAWSFPRAGMLAAAALAVAIAAAGVPFFPRSFLPAFNEGSLVLQIAVRLDHRKAAQAGLAPGEAVRLLKALTDGSHSAEVVEGQRRCDLVLRLPDDRRSPRDLADTLIDTPAGRLPVSAIATVEEIDGSNQIGRENSRRRIVVYANTDGSDMNRIVARVRVAIAAEKLSDGYFVRLEGQFQAQEQASRLIAGLVLLSLGLMFLVLYSRYRSMVLAGLIMANIPLALIGSAAAMWIAGVSLSVASMVGFITLAASPRATAS